MSKTLLISRNDAVLHLTLNRPDRRNALTVELLEALNQALSEATEDGSVRIVTLRGSGADFSSGFDLAEGADVEVSVRHGELLVRAQMQLARMTAVCVAMVDGFALAGGGALVAACDWVVATESAKFGYPVLKVGIVPTPGVPFLRRQISDRALRELVFSGELHSGTWAFESGLSSALAATQEDALAQRDAFIAKVLAGSPDAVSTSKRFFFETSGRGLQEEMEAALVAYAQVRRGAQSSEGLRAFLEKRSPVWPAT